ncbi:transporter substrate-binding domain-containing protein [Nitratireductor soli]|uniref:transporter substrate-binding domain-containing protein n=1 Tax=Nitratireductor soli TaxID=1670619 RepID=UPI00065E7502|nr:transporter substrate-binding domain-containing protein [Nitratireductor soli]
MMKLIYHSFTQALAIASISAASAGTIDKVRFGVEADVPPFESRDSDGDLVGLNIEIGNAICSVMEISCVWIDQPYATNIDALKNGKFDVIMPMTPTERRREQIDFTDAMYALSSRLVAPKGVVLEPTANALAGKRIGVLNGTSRENFARDRWGSAGVEIIGFGLNSELIQALRGGEIDATLQDTVEIAEALLNKPEGAAYAFTGEVVSDPALGSGIAMGIRQNEDQLKDILNEGLARLSANGQLETILAQYLPDQQQAMSSGTRPQLEYISGESALPFSEAVRAGNMLYLSGVLGDDENGIFPETTAEQTANILDTYRTVLEANGSSLDQVVRCTVILANLDDFAEMNRVYAGYFPERRRPARTTFEASKLIANGKIEIDCMAYAE